MKVEILTSIASKDYSYAVGDKVKLTTEQADRFVNAGIAKEVETATVKKEKETTTKKASQKKVDKDADNR